MKYRKAIHRSDPGEPAIVEALERAGCTVARWGDNGAPDLVVGRAGVTWLLEVKAPIGPKGGHTQDGQRLSQRQLAWHQRWRGHVDVVRTPEEALQAIHAIRPDEVNP